MRHKLRNSKRRNTAVSGSSTKGRRTGSGTSSDVTPAEFHIPPRTEWPHRILSALVREYAQPPELICGVEVAYGVSLRRLFISAGIRPEEGLPGPQKGLDLEVRRILDELIKPNW
jgi:hypothetical protein